MVMTLSPDPALPRLTIGLPVYNGGAPLREALTCLRDQDLKAIRVILGDNGSQDDTALTCAEFAASDPRFEHHRIEQTIDPIANYRRVRDLASTEFFAWRAFDDLSDTDYFPQLIAQLDAAPRAMLAVGRTERIDMNAKVLKRTDWTGRAGPSALRLYRHLFQGSACWFYGVWRRDACVEITDHVMHHYPEFWGWDHATLFQVAIRDGLVGTNETRFYQRHIKGTRDHVTRRRKDLADMTRQNKLFTESCRKGFPAVKDPASRLALRIMLPFFVNRRCHTLRRRIKAAVLGPRTRS